MPSAPSSPIARGMGTGAFWACPGVTGVLWATLSVSVLAEESYTGITFTFGVPACAYLQAFGTRLDSSSKPSLPLLMARH